MSDQLDFECPVCHTECKIPSTFTRVHCVCGTKVERKGTVHPSATAPTAEPATVAARVLACEPCPRYHNRRCDILDQGCRRTYQKQLYAVDGHCPDGLWHISVNTD